MRATMQFDWNEAITSHIARHHITPEEAEQVIENDSFDGGSAFLNGELRRVHIGETDMGRVLAVVVTERGEMLRVVTARDRRPNERGFFAIHKAAANDEILDTPEFNSEAEEAAWWNSHPDEAFSVLETAAKDGSLGQGTLVHRAQTAATSIRLDTTDIELAKVQAKNEA